MIGNGIGYGLCIEMEAETESAPPFAEIDANRNGHGEAKEDAAYSRDRVVAKGEVNGRGHRSERERNDEAKAKGVAFGADGFAVSVVLKVAVPGDAVKDDLHHLALSALVIVRLVDLDLVRPRWLRVRRTELEPVVHEVVVLSALGLRFGHSRDDPRGGNAKHLDARRDVAFVQKVKDQNIADAAGLDAP